MKNYRIVLVEYDHPFLKAKKVTHALQKRIGIFFWYTVARCDSMSQCLTVYRNTKGKKERIVKTLQKM